MRMAREMDVWCQNIQMREYGWLTWRGHVYWGLDLEALTLLLKLFDWSRALKLKDTIRSVQVELSLISYSTVSSQSLVTREGYLSDSEGKSHKPKYTVMSLCLCAPAFFIPSHWQINHILIRFFSQTEFSLAFGLKAHKQKAANNKAVVWFKVLQQGKMALLSFKIWEKMV